MNTTNDFVDRSYQQHTLANSFTCTGSGLHSGKNTVLSVLPGEVNTGIVFIRKDVQGVRSEIQASWKNIKEHRFSICVSNAFGVQVNTIEHIMAALYACDIDNAKILIDGPEIPFMDGSADIFVSLINQVGVLKQNAQRHAIIVKKPVSITTGDKFAAILPSPISWIEVESEPNFGETDTNAFTAPIHRKIFEDQLASARVVIFSEQLNILRKRGLLLGGTIKNSVLVDNGKVMNKEGLRFPDEYIRHELVNCIGDISLLGARLIGQFTTVHTDHAINQALIKKLHNEKEAWEYSTVKKSQAYWAQILKNRNADSPLVQNFMSRLDLSAL